MDQSTAYANISSPSISHHGRLPYGDYDQYLDASHSSDSHSSATSPVSACLLSYGDPGCKSSLHCKTQMDDMALSRGLVDASTDGGSETAIPPATTASQPGGGNKLTTKRKRENRYKNAPPSVLSVRSITALVEAPLAASGRRAAAVLPRIAALTVPLGWIYTYTSSPLQRRRAQNRASQRAYRERKDQRIKDLEQLLNEAQARHDVLSQAYADLHAAYLKLKTAAAPPPDVLQHRQQPAGMTSSPSASSTTYAAHQLPRTATPASVAADMGARFMDTSAMAVLNAGSDLEAYLYSDVQGYQHM